MQTDTYKDFGQSKVFHFTGQILNSVFFLFLTDPRLTRAASIAIVLGTMYETYVVGSPRPFIKPPVIVP